MLYYLIRFKRYFQIPHPHFTITLGIKAGLLLYGYVPVLLCAAKSPDVAPLIAHDDIMIPCACNVRLFYIVKLGLTGVYIIFLFLLYNIDHGYSLESPQ